MKHRSTSALALATLVAVTTPALTAAGTGSAAASVSTQSRAATSSGSDIRVASFNVQSVSLDRTSGAQRPWKLRRNTIVSQILNGRVDVIGVQEVNPSKSFASRLSNPANRNQYFDLRAGLNHFGTDHYSLQTGAAANCVDRTTTYRCVYQNRRASGSNRILFNTRTLRQVTYGHTEFTQASAANPVAGVTWSRLAVRATGAQFLFVTTHLDPKSRSVRLAQWKQLISTVNKVKGNLPVVATGDYNTHRGDTMSAEMLPSMKKAGYGDVLNQQFGQNKQVGVRAESLSHAWVNSYNHQDLNVRNYSWDDRRSNLGFTIDYVFASNGLRVKSYKVVLRFSSTKLRVYGTLPSDHNMVRATITIP